MRASTRSIGEFETRLPEGPHYYPDDMITDQPESFLAAELVREQLLKVARDELPHSITVVAEIDPERRQDVVNPDGSVGEEVLHISARILVERDSQKGMVIGKRGAVLKEAGTRARRARASARHAGVPRNPRLGGARLAASRPFFGPSRVLNARLVIRPEIGRENQAAEVADREHVPCRVPTAFDSNDVRAAVLEGDMTPRRMRTARRSRARTARRGALVAVVVSSLALAGCAEAKNNGQNTFKPHGPDAQKIFDLFAPVAILAIAVGIFIIIATVYVGIKFRYREGKNENPKQVHGNTKLEIGWTMIPALLLAVIAVPTIGTIFDLAQTPPDSALQVTVVGKQWWWEFKYPDAKVITANELHIPVGRKVALTLKACDQGACNVIHSFWVPELSGTRDVVPGHVNELTLSASEPGTYLGQCKEYCGLSHANMRFRVIAQSPSDFADWLSGQQQGPVNALEGARSQQPRRAGRRRRAGAAADPEVPVHQLPHLRRLVGRQLRAEPHPPGQSHHVRKRLLQARARPAGGVAPERAGSDPDVVPGLSRSRR